MKKAKTSLILTVLALLIMFVGIIVALFAELNTSTIHDGESVPTSISTHVLVIMLFVLVSDVMLLIANKMKASDGKLYMPYWLFHCAYAITGLFFSIASAYQARANSLLDFYWSIKDPTVPPVYAEVFTSHSWFETLPEHANGFSSSSTVFYVLTVVSAIATVVLLVRILSNKKETNSQDNDSNNSNE